MSSYRRFDKIDIYISMFFSCSLLGACISKGICKNARTRMLVYDRSISDCECIFRSYLCMYHSLHVHR